MAKKGGQKAQAPAYGGGYGSQTSALTPQGGGRKKSGQAMQAPAYNQQAQGMGQTFGQPPPSQGGQSYSSMATAAAAPPQQQGDGLSMTGGQLDPNYNNNQFNVGLPTNLARPAVEPRPPGQVPFQPPAQPAPKPAPTQSKPSTRAPVRADLYNAMHPYAQKLQGDAQGMANVPQQTSSWRDIKVAPGDKEAFARRRAAQEAEYKATHTIVPGKGGMSVSYNNANYTDPRIANMAYMSSTLRGQAPGMGTSVPGSDRSMNFKGR